MKKIKMELSLKKSDIALMKHFSHLFNLSPDESIELVFFIAKHFPTIPLLPISEADRIFKFADQVMAENDLIVSEETTIH